MVVRFLISCACFMTVVFSSSSLMAISGERPAELKDIFFGEIFFHAYQENYFDAIAMLDAELGQFYAIDEPELDPLSFHLGEAEFSLGDFELAYRMHHKAGRALNAILNSKVDQSIRNEAAYRLARIHYKQQDPVNALHALELIKGKVPERVKDAESFLRAQVYVGTGRFTDAVDLLKDLKGSDEFEGFAEYNLGIAMLQSGQEQKGLGELSDFGRSKASNPAVLTLRDKANLMLGYRLLETDSPEEARPYFERVRLDGLYSNQALLGMGWVDATAKRFDRALVPWSLLHERQKVDKPVQESMMAVPYAYGQLNVHSKAAIMYGEALEVFGKEIDSLGASIKNIREGKFLKALLSEQAQRDKNWLVNLRELPDTPETHYFLDLMASHDYQEFLLNYKDLSDLHEQNKEWLKNLDAYEEIIAIRRAYYEPLLPVIEQQFKKLDSRMRLRVGQRDRLDDRLKSMLISRRPDYLAYANERQALARLERIQSYLASNPRHRTPEVKYRISRLNGVLNWQVATEYDERLTEAYNNLHQLDEVIDELNKRYKSFVRTRQAATQSYEGYGFSIQKLRTRLQAAQVKLKGLMARQGHMLEALTINELDQRRAQLESYQIKARFALAESYDRANKAEEEKLNKALLKQGADKGAKQ